MIQKIFLWCAFLIIISCGGANTPPENPENPKAALEPFYCNDIARVDETQVQENEDISRTQILKYEIVEQCLCLKYQYSGCVQGEHMLVWDVDNDTTPHSNRPEVMMQLLVREAGMCEQLLTDSSCFSMKELHLVGNEILVYINDKQKNILLNFDSLPGED